MSIADYKFEIFESIEYARSLDASASEFVRLVRLIPVLYGLGDIGLVV